MFHRNKKSVRIISSIIIILLVLAMLASTLLYLYKKEREKSASGLCRVCEANLVSERQLTIV